MDALNVINQPTGAGVFSIQMLSAIAAFDSKHEITVLIRQDLSEDHELCRLPFMFRRVDIPTLGLKREVKLPILIRQLKHSFDFFFSFMPYTSIFPLALPYAVTVHDVAFFRYPEFAKSWFHRWYFFLLMRRSLLPALQLFAVSESTRSDISNFFHVPLENIQIVYPNINHFNDSTIKNFRPLDNPYFLFVGERRKHKNIANMLRAFAVFKKQDTEKIKFVLIGRDYDEEYSTSLKKLIQELHIAEHVTMLGSIPTERLKEFYTYARAFIFVSAYEGFGIPILEAMKQGVPVLTSDTFSMPEAGGEAALYADPNDIQNIAAQMTTVATDESIRAMCIERGLEQTQKFSWETSAETILEFFDTYATSNA